VQLSLMECCVNSVASLYTVARNPLTIRDLL
jgi:hypothetical protein